ncbi:MAG: hypothetical protein JXK05_07585 [Campylobacterales bacterium]|nr:hypothetical protein [Campylobacterales bacterium]
MFGAIKTHHHLSVADIVAHLHGVEYIILAQPAPKTRYELPIHFTIFLNTHTPLPSGVKEAVFEKFCDQYEITKTADIMSEIAPVAFAQTDKATLMPMHLFKTEDQQSIPNVPLYVIDFLGDAKGFHEVKVEGQTGWSYSYS